MFSDPGATIFIPDGAGYEEAMGRCTHLGIGAHPDDLEFMAFHGIRECYESETNWFGGVTCTHGQGSSRSGSFADLSDEELGEIRRGEQNAAATLGRYGAMVQLNHSSAAIQAGKDALAGDLRGVLNRMRPEVVYTHNPADKHETHVAVFAATLRALRSLPFERKPTKVWGCEVWRDLDWLPDEEKILLDVGGHDTLATALNEVFESQIAGGKRYDLAIMGRRRANATFLDAHLSDGAAGLTFALDLMPLVADSSLDPAAYVLGFLDRFREDVASKLARHLS